jgi:hypothetical protein
VGWRARRLASLREPWSVATSTRIKLLLILSSPQNTRRLDGIGLPSGVTVEEVVVVDVVVQRCAGIDVSKRDAKVCVRIQGSGSRKTSTPVSTWPATSPQIVKLRDQLLADRVELVVMESTSDYVRHEGA